MNEEKRPLGATVAIVIMAIASLWWLMLGILYFFGAFWWWYAGFPFAWLWGILYGLMGFIGLGITAGLYMRLRQSYNATLILSIIFVVFSIPALLSGYGIVGAIMSGILLIVLLMPSVKAYFNRDQPPPEYVENVTSV